MGRHGRLGGKLVDFESGAKLNEQQKAAIAQVLNCRDEFLFLSGAAGVGKTHTLSVLHQALKKAGQQVVALAPSQTAVQELQAVGFRNAFTLQKLLMNPEKAKVSLAGKLVICDESGLIGAKDMSDFLQIAHSAGARVLLVGDVKQLSSVAGGEPVRILEKYSFMRTVSITKVERQQVAAYREAMEVFRENSARGLSKLETMGAILEVLPENRAAMVALAYESECKKLNSKGQKQSVLVVATTHNEIELITSEIRKRKLERRELGNGQECYHLKALHWTEAQRGAVDSFQRGQYLVFHRETKQAAKDSAWQIAQVVKEKKEVLARGADGQEIWLKMNQLKKAFGVFERQKIEVRVGDKLLLQANFNKNGVRFTNGELVDVATVTTQDIQLADGRILPGGYEQFTYGVSVTANKSQGTTVDSVIVSAEGMRNKKQAYVALSRGRERVKLITSNQEAFLDAIEHTSERKSAVELMGNESIRVHRARRVLDAILSRGQQLILDTQTRLSSVLSKDGARNFASQGNHTRGKH